MTSRRHYPTVFVRFPCADILLPPRELVYIAPSGVQKELMKPSDLYVLSLPQTLEKHNQATKGNGPIRPASRVYLRSPTAFKPSQCTPLFLSAFTRKGAKCCIHTHSPAAVLVTLILEQQTRGSKLEFRINNIEQIKGLAKGYPRKEMGNLGYHDTLTIPVIENTAHEEDLTEFMEEAMEKYPDAYAVLVRRHGIYVWGDTVEHAKTQCERYVDAWKPMSLRSETCLAGNCSSWLTPTIVWTISSTWLWRCTSWVCHGSLILSLPYLVTLSRHKIACDFLDP